MGWCRWGRVRDKGVNGRGWWGWAWCMCSGACLPGCYGCSCQLSCVGVPGVGI